MKRFLSVKIVLSLLCAVAAMGNGYASGWDGRKLERSAEKAQVLSPRQISRFPVSGAVMPKASKVEAYAGTGSETLVLGENFDKFAAGSEDAPDMTNILESNGIIMRDYVQTYGWAGINLYQAGGSCFIADGTQAILASPVVDLSGDGGQFTLRMSARSQSGTEQFYVMWGSSSPVAGF